MFNLLSKPGFPQIIRPYFTEVTGPSSIVTSSGASTCAAVTALLAVDLISPCYTTGTKQMQCFLNRERKNVMYTYAQCTRRAKWLRFCHRLCFTKHSKSVPTQQPTKPGNFIREFGKFISLFISVPLLTVYDVAAWTYSVLVFKGLIKSSKFAACCSIKCSQIVVNSGHYL